MSLVASIVIQTCQSAFGGVLDFHAHKEFTGLSNVSLSIMPLVCTLSSLQQFVCKRGETRHVTNLIDGYFSHPSPATATLIQQLRPTKHINIIGYLLLTRDLVCLDQQIDEVYVRQRQIERIQGSNKENIYSLVEFSRIRLFVFLALKDKVQNDRFPFW